MRLIILAKLLLSADVARIGNKITAVNIVGKSRNCVIPIVCVCVCVLCVCVCVVCVLCVCVC